ncbi:MAG: hypothetical protein ABJN40_07555 [Sneathiella sp.]
MARLILSRSFVETFPGSLSARDTVIELTLARAATSEMVVLPEFLRVRSVFVPSYRQLIDLPY